MIQSGPSGKSEVLEPGWNSIHLQLSQASNNNSNNNSSSNNSTYSASLGQGFY